MIPDTWWMTDGMWLLWILTIVVLVLAIAVLIKLKKLPSINDRGIGQRELRPRLPVRVPTRK